MTKKHYEELLTARHPLVTNSNEWNLVRILGWSIYGNEFESVLLPLAERITCLKNGKSPRDEVLEIQITPKEILLFDNICFMTRLNRSIMINSLVDFEKNIKTFIEQYHPDSIKEKNRKTHES